MIKRTFFIVLFLALGSLYALGQTSDNAEINVSATVIGSTQNSIELITVNTIQFGNAQPINGQININPINSLNAGFMIAEGNPEAECGENEAPRAETRGALITRHYSEITPSAMTISTRRFFARPSRVSLSATGRVRP